jgi:hypothetical protein
MKNTLLIIFLSLLIFSTYIDISAKPEDYHLIGEIGGGLSYKATANLNPNYQYNNLGFATCARIKWQPDNLLNIGIESGYVRISTIETGEQILSNKKTVTEKIVRNAIPVMFNFSMTLKNFEIIAGLGYYYETVKSNANNTIYSISSYDWMMGYLIGFEYKIPLTQYMYLSPELKYYFISEYHQSLLSMQLNIGFDLLKW